MMFWNILKNDIARGIFKRKYLYIISTVVIAALVIIADMSLGRKTVHMDIQVRYQWGICFRCFTGAAE